MGKFAVLGNELYSGKKSIDFVGRKWLWYGVSAVILAIAIGGWTAKGLNFGIEFTGGSQYIVTLPSEQVTQDTADEIREVVAGHRHRERLGSDRHHPGVRVDRRADRVVVRR